MKINGYKLRELIKNWTLKKDLALDSFNNSLFSFEKENPEDPQVYLEEFIEAENAIANLQVIQSDYNNQVYVKDCSESVSLKLKAAIKYLGTIEREIKVLKTALAKQPMTSGFNAYVKNNDEQFAIKQISDSSLKEKITLRSQRLNELRSVIASANATECEMTINDNLVI